MILKEVENFNSFCKKVSNPLYIRLFMLQKLPSAYFCGVRLVSINEENCLVSIKHTWFNKNPFKSIYFACLAMAAEMSTGMLVLGYTHQHLPKISVIVTKMEAVFTKKARGKITFNCPNGRLVAAALAELKSIGKTNPLNLIANGIDEAGDIVATFTFTWAFKISIM